VAREVAEVQELQRAGLDSRAVEAAVELSAVLAEALLEQRLVRLERPARGDVSN